MTDHQVHKSIAPAAPAPKAAELRNAYAILGNTQRVSDSFLAIYEKMRKSRKAWGTTTDEEQDVLRAMLIFASAGLDSMTKHLIRDALPAVISRDEGARAQFRTFIEKRLAQRDPLDVRFLSAVLTAADSQAALTAELVNDLAAGSLQSKDALFRAGSYFNIASKAITTDTALLDLIFRARNEIAHEMDIDFAQKNRKRRPRRKDDMLKYTREILRLGEVLLDEVERRL